MYLNEKEPDKLRMRQALLTLSVPEDFVLDAQRDNDYNERNMSVFHSTYTASCVNI